MNNENKIGKDVLEKVMASVDMSLEADELESIFTELDPNSTGFIEKEAFFKLIKYGEKYSEVK